MCMPMFWACLALQHRELCQRIYNRSLPLVLFHLSSFSPHSLSITQLRTYTNITCLVAHPPTSYFASHSSLSLFPIDASHQEPPLAPCPTANTWPGVQYH